MSGSLQLSHATFLLAAAFFYHFAVSLSVSVGWGASEPVPVCSWDETDQKCWLLELKILYQGELVKFPL